MNHSLVATHLLNRIAGYNTTAEPCEKRSKKGNMYPLPPEIPPEIARKVDPNGGFLCVWTHWRPDPEAPDSDMPGHKLMMTTYIPVADEDDCLCGSGEQFRHCCQPKTHWHPICPNPAMQGYSLMEPQAATFHDVDGVALRERLLADERLHCVEDNGSNGGFWSYWGSPALEAEYGILCFGDIELKGDTLLATALSDLRMETLLDLLEEIAGDCLDTPQIQADPPPSFEKQVKRPQMRDIRPMRRRKRRK